MIINVQGQIETNIFSQQMAWWIVITLEILFCSTSLDQSCSSENTWDTISRTGGNLISKIPVAIKFFFSYKASSEFPSLRLFQSESKCKTILMRMTLICLKMKLHAELIFALWLVLKQVQEDSERTLYYRSCKFKFKNFMRLYSHHREVNFPGWRKNIELNLGFQELLLCCFRLE